MLDFVNFWVYLPERAFPQLFTFLRKGILPLPSKFTTLKLSSPRNIRPNIYKVELKSCSSCHREEKHGELLMKREAAKEGLSRRGNNPIFYFFFIESMITSMFALEMSLMPTSFFALLVLGLYTTTVGVFSTLNFLVICLK